MRGSRNFRHRRGGGGPRQHDKKSSDNVFFLFFFFSFFLVLRLFNRSQMVNFKEKISFFKVPEGVQIFLWGGGVLLFPGGGVHCLFPIETHITCDFPWGVRTPCPPSGSAIGCNLFSFPVRKMMRSRLAPVLVFLQLRCMYSVEHRNKIVS